MHEDAPPTECAFTVELVVLQGPCAGQREILDSFPMVIGRGREADVGLDDLKLSRAHLRVSVDSGHIKIVDQSTNGTWVNGRQLKPGEPYFLAGGESVALGTNTVVSFILQGSGVPAPSIPSEAPPLTAGRSPTIDLDVDVLGPVRVRAGGRHLDTKSAPKAMVLLACLADGPQGRTMSAERLIDLLWGENLGDARAALQAAVSRLRRAFRSADASLPDPVLLDAGGYRFSDRYHVLCDTQELERLCDEAARAHAQDRLEEAAALLERAIALYRGPLLPGQSNDWVDLRRRALESRVLDAMDSLAEVREKQGSHAQAVRIYEGVLERETCRERSQLGFMRSLVALGRRDEALRSYYDFVARLKKEMGLGPSPELIVFYEEMRAT